MKLSFLSDPERAQRPWRLVFVAGLCATLVLALVPSVPEALSTGWDKSNHVLAFFVLTVLGCLAFPRHRSVPLALLVLFGVAIEVLQALTPTRQSDWHDVVADVIGIVLALLVMPLILRLVPAARR
ncbi:VanZ family protein [Amphibiibacter pelophylacis]|uniref:VanZ family protein n=1 Tax=Amphibiibacter pelophylacis TaxID=1799477 RepID=A0ACC6NZV6_9BURK